MAYFGLYVGNSTASIAEFRDDGKVTILANEAGERVTPAVVVLTSKEKDVGSMAGATSYSLNPFVIRNNKTLLDLSLTTESLSKFRSASQVKIEGEIESISYTIFETDKKPLVSDPVEVASLIFSKLYGIGAACATGIKELSCVLSVPYHWDNESRNKMKESAMQAGWKVMQIINEPTAALLAYRIGFEKPPQDELVLVYRLGGISCDASVVKLENGFQRILGCKRLERGCQDIVSALTNYLAVEFHRKFKLDPKESRKAMWKLKTAATALLHTLSTLSSANRFIESVYDGVDFNVSLSRARIESLISPLVSTFTEPIKSVLTMTKAKSNDITKVILTGGALKIPMLQTSVSSMFTCTVYSSLNLDEVYAIGAAEQAGLLSSLSEDLTLESSTEICFLAKPIEISFNGQENIKIEKLPIPNVFSTQLKINTKELEITARIDKEVKQLIIVEDLTGSLEIHLKITEDELQFDGFDENHKKIVKTNIVLNELLC